MTKDQTFAVCCLLFSIYLGYEVFAYPSDSSFFPRVLTVVMGSLSLLFFLRKSFSRKSGGAVNTEKDRPTCKSESGLVSGDADALKAAALVFVSIAVYSMLIGVVNYEVATILFLTSMMLLLKFARIGWIFVIAGGFMGLLWGIFFHLLGVSRPDSIFFS